MKYVFFFSSQFSDAQFLKERVCKLDLASQYELRHGGQSRLMLVYKPIKHIADEVWRFEKVKAGII